MTSGRGLTGSAEAVCGLSAAYPQAMKPRYNEDGRGSLDEEKRKASSCVRCTTVTKAGYIPLVAGRIHVVYGRGRPDADLMFIGEAPGEQEDIQGEPFVGDAGKALVKRLLENHVPPEDVYITNTVKCRPTKEEKDRPPSNRPPCEDEIEACRDWLDAQVRLVNPKLVVPLGVPATSRVLGRKVLMRSVHGKPEVISDAVGSRSVWNGRTIIPTYHPTGTRSSQEWQAFLSDFEVIGDAYRGL
jgi:uracil-DNA glycosylase